MELEKKHIEGGKGVNVWSERSSREGRKEGMLRERKECKVVKDERRMIA